MKRFFLIVCAVFMIMACVTSCSSNYSSSVNDKSSQETDKPKEISRSEAINKVKDYPLLDQKIATELGFQSFTNPNYGAIEAKEHTYSTTGSSEWIVIIKGNMTGYIDDYRTKLKTYQFTLEGRVSKDDGSTRIVYVHKS